MTDPRFSPVDELDRETVREPSKRWVNWWRGAFHGWCHACGAHLPADIVYSDCCQGPYPSKDIAETEASEDIAAQLKHSPVADEYLGAYPDGEAP